MKLRSASKPITNIEQYPAILAELNQPHALSDGVNMLAWFPAQIPADAENTRLFFRRQYWQSGTILQLRCKLPAEKIAVIDARAASVAKQTTQGSKDEFSEVNAHHGLPTADFSLTDKPGAALSDDFSVYVIDAGSRPPPVEPWDAGYSYGIAVSKERNEVIYWLEDW